MKQSFWDRLWRDRQGRVVVVQLPNTPLAVWIVLTVAAHFTTGATAVGLGTVASAFLFVWAYGEVTAGESYFRRALGLVVLVALVHSLLIK